MMQKDATVTEKQHKSSKTTSHDHSVYVKFNVNFCFMSGSHL